MAHRVCPWWLGYLLASPVRRLLQDPRKILSPFIAGGMTVLEPGPGMGFFTIEMARLVGEKGTIVAVDIEPKMLEGLRRRARREGVLDRMDVRQATPSGLGLQDLDGRVDFALAFAVIHELPDQERFFADVHAALKSGGEVLVAEPRGHVKEPEFRATFAGCRRGGVSRGRQTRHPAQPLGRACEDMRRALPRLIGARRSALCARCGPGVCRAVQFSVPHRSPGPRDHALSKCSQRAGDVPGSGLHRLRPGP